MIKQPIDTTKELRFYTSKIIIVGIVVLSVAVGFVSVKYLFFYSYNNLQLGLAIGGLVLPCCLSGIVWSAYILAVDPLRLSINKDGIYSPRTGNLPWRSIKDIRVGLTAEYGEEPMLLKIELIDGKSYNLYSGLFIRLDTRKLLEILRTYHGSMPPNSNRSSLLN